MRKLNTHTHVRTCCVYLGQVVAGSILSARPLKWPLSCEDGTVARSSYVRTMRKLSQIVTARVKLAFEHSCGGHKAFAGDAIDPGQGAGVVWRASAWCDREGRIASIVDPTISAVDGLQNSNVSGVGSHGSFVVFAERFHPTPVGCADQSAVLAGRFRGREVNTSGDGFLAMFDGPQRAIRCAMSIRDAVQALGIEVRAGLHTGECEVRGDDIGGIAVHIGARVSALAGANDVLVSSTLRDLVIGSGLEFDERGAHQLKGVPGEWHLFNVASP